MSNQLGAYACAFGLALLGVGCEASDRVENRLDCRQICDRYAECVDDDFDLDECRDNCRDNANDDEDFERRVDECSDCIDGDDSCVESAFQCTAECIGIVP